MPRITLADLQAIVARINRVTGSPSEPYSMGADGRHHANPGCYHLSRAYGGFALHRMVNDGGGVADVLRSGHVPARELQGLMCAWLEGRASAGEQP